MKNTIKRNKFFDKHRFSIFWYEIIYLSRGKRFMMKSLMFSEKTLLYCCVVVVVVIIFFKVMWAFMDVISNGFSSCNGELHVYKIFTDKNLNNSPFFITRRSYIIYEKIFLLSALVKSIYNNVQLVL